MSWFLRKAFRLGPLRFNLSKSGIGVSAGVKGARIGVDARGRSYVNAGRGGIYFRKTLSATGPLGEDEQQLPESLRPRLPSVIPVVGAGLLGLLIVLFQREACAVVNFAFAILNSKNQCMPRQPILGQYSWLILALAVAASLLWIVRAAGHDARVAAWLASRETVERPPMTREEMRAAMQPRVAESRRADDERSPPQGMREHLRGSGAFALPVVGESHYQETLEAICGPRSDDGEDRRVEARLVLENDNPYDSMAVRVDIQGQAVGYLSREHARRYRNQSASTDADCNARIRGGWDRGEGRQGYYGVFLDLDLPMDDSNATSHMRTGQNERGRLFSARLDDHGQPPKPLYAPRVAKRLVSELLGLCKGMVCDGEIVEGELVALKRWLAGHRDAALLYPGKVVAERLLRIYEDGIVTADERKELNELLLDLTGETEEHDQPLNLSTRLPFDEPTPTILFEDHEHVFTGRMLYGTRQVCETKVVERGGRVSQTVTKRTNFLVIGPIASSAWLESAHGRKILRAVELRSEGLPLRIVSEEAWIHAVESA